MFTGLSRHLTRRAMPMALAACLLPLFCGSAHAVTVDVKVKSTWSSGYTADLVVGNNTNSAIIGWNLSLTLGNSIDSVSRATFSGSDPYSFKPLSYSNSIAAGSSERIAIKALGALDSKKLSGCVFNGSPCTLLVNGVPVGNQPPPPPPAGNKPPNAVAAGPATARVGESVRFTSAGSSDPDGSLASYAWDLGDGTKSSAASVSHTYSRAGSYTVSLTVTDNKGARDSDSDQIVISNNPPPPPPPPPPSNSKVDRTFFQNDWDGNDRDNRNCARDWESQDIWRHAWGLYDVKNKNSRPSTRTLDLEAGAQRIATLSKTGRVDIALGGGAGQMLLLLEAVDSFGGKLSNIHIVSHSVTNEDNRDGGTGQYPPYGPEAMRRVLSMIGSSNFKRIPNQNNYAYGARGSDKSTDISDFGMLHYLVYGQETPTTRRLTD